jgi:molybdopterin converting factor small subunit
LKKGYNHTMPIIKIPTPLRPHTEGKRELELEGKTAGEVLDALCRLYPEFREHFFDEKGKLRKFVNIILGETRIKDLQGLDTPLAEGDVLRILASISGG